MSRGRIPRHGDPATPEPEPKRDMVVVPFPTKLIRESVSATQREVATPCEVLWIPVPVSYTCWPWLPEHDEFMEAAVFLEDGTHIGYVRRLDIS